MLPLLREGHGDEASFCASQARGQDRLDVRETVHGAQLGLKEGGNGGRVRGAALRGFRGPQLLLELAEVVRGPHVVQVEEAEVDSARPRRLQRLRRRMKK